MTTYVIGDLQGCLTPLQRLLDKINFDPVCDCLWFVGDLVNRGSESLQSLRFVKSLGTSAITVLGNHDLHLLAVIHGIRQPSKKDTLQQILRAHDCHELGDWLRRLPLLHHDAATGYTMVHAGIHPHWDLAEAQHQANDLQHVLAAKHYVEFLSVMYGNQPANCSPNLSTTDRRRLAINVFTRMRMCYANGTLDFDYNGSPAKAPAHLQPWYQIAGRKSRSLKIVFGHWSSHPAIAQQNVIPLDRGCVWGGSMAAFALQSTSTVTIRCGV